jgi:hypothetical protein
MGKKSVMKPGSKLLLSTVIGAAVVLFVLKQKNKQADQPSPNENISQLPSSQVSATPAQNSLPTSTTNSTQNLATTPSPHKPNVTPEDHSFYPQGPLSFQEVQSVNNIVKTISQAIAKRSNSTAFMQAVQALNLKPKFMDEGTTAVGSMITVRTHDALEGTRYLHAQFTGVKNNADYLEHVSFQIRPGSDSFQKAVEILNQFLPKNKKVKESSSDYVLYNTDDGYVAWAKIATREDLKSNNYNASSKEDVGSVIVTIEQEIHDMDEDGHSH